MILSQPVQHKVGTLGRLGILLFGLMALVGCTPILAGDDPEPTDAAVAQSDGLEEADDDPFSPPSLAPTSGQQPAKLDPFVDEREADPVAGDTASPPIAESKPLSADDRLKRLEDRFDALLAELRTLRSAPHAAPASRDKAEINDLEREKARKHEPPKVVRETFDGFVPTQPNTSKRAALPRNNATDTRANPVAPDDSVAIFPPAKSSPGLVPSSGSDLGDPATAIDIAEGEPVILTRATYKLPADKAEEIADFLKAQLSDEIDVRVKGNSLQVTATRSDQNAISQFIRLLQTRPAVVEKPRTESLDDERFSPEPTFVPNSRKRH